MSEKKIEYPRIVEFSTLTLIQSSTMQGCCGVVHNILDLRLHFLWTNVCFGSKGKGKLRRKWKEKEEEEKRKGEKAGRKKTEKNETIITRGWCTANAHIYVCKSLQFLTVIIIFCRAKHTHLK